MYTLKVLQHYNLTTFIHRRGTYWKREKSFVRW